MEYELEEEEEEEEEEEDLRSRMRLRRAVVSCSKCQRDYSDCNLCTPSFGLEGLMKNSCLPH